MSKLRGSTRRSWIKLFITGWLHGSVRWQLTPAERGCFADLLCMAGECNQGGRICDNDGRAFPFEFLANHLNLSLELLQSTIDKCTGEGRIRSDGGVLVIGNWGAYQSEYQRQKPYREKKEKYAGTVELSEDEYKKLVERFGQAGADERIEKLSLYIQSKGDKYKNHYATILNWERMDNGTHRGDTQEDRAAKRAASVGAPLTGRRG